jgi:hypothetical protein
LAEDTLIKSESAVRKILPVLKLRIISFLNLK